MKTRVLGSPRQDETLKVLGTLNNGNGNFAIAQT